MLHLEVLNQVEVGEHPDGAQRGFQVRQLEVAEAEVGDTQGLGRGHHGRLEEGAMREAQLTVLGFTVGNSTFAFPWEWDTRETLIKEADGGRGCCLEAEPRTGCEPGAPGVPCGCPACSNRWH